MNEFFVDRISSFAAHLYWFLQRKKGYTLRCCQKIQSSWFVVQDALQAPDATWDSATYMATTLQSLAHFSFDADMASLGVRDIAPELLEELERKHPGRKQVFSMEAMEKAAVFMQIKPGYGTNFSQVGFNTSAISENTHTTTGQQSLQLVTSVEAESNLSQARQEFQCLYMRLWKMSPAHTIFSKGVD